MDQVKYVAVCDYYSLTPKLNSINKIRTGQTSSQAQIGFKPESASNSQGSNIFNGGGQASAQSGVHSGLSQSQIQGNFKYILIYSNDFTETYLSMLICY